MPQETLPEAIGQYTEHPCKGPAHKGAHWSIFSKGEPFVDKMPSATNGLVVVTQVYPQQTGTAPTGPCTVLNVPSLLGKFLRGEPKALGAVQILIGVMYILLGIVLSLYADSIGVFSGIVFWGAFIVKGSLAMNIISTITAGVAVILFSLDLVIGFHNYYCQSYDCYQLEQMYETRTRAISGILLVFSILEFIITICVSAFACRAVCEPTLENAVFIQNPQASINTVTTGYPPSPHVNMYETIHTSNVGQGVLNNCTPVRINSETEPSKLC